MGNYYETKRVSDRFRGCCASESVGNCSSERRFGGIVRPEGVEVNWILKTWILKTCLEASGAANHVARLS